MKITQMDIRTNIKEIFAAEGITEVGFIRFEDCVPANERLYGEVRSWAKAAAVFLMPYRVSFIPEDQYAVSAYARVRDYHKRFAELTDILLPKLSALGYTFRGYADHSPIREKTAAADCGLGVIGLNTLLINERYGSYVFIGSFITDADTGEDRKERKSCLKCGKCVKACPGGVIGENKYDFERCLSYISQKKVKTPDEYASMRKHSIVWGCDICQNVCPMNAGAAYSRDSYFTDSVITDINRVLTMSEDEFVTYPFSWRRRSVISANIENCVSGVDSAGHI